MTWTLSDKEYGFNLLTEKAQLAYLTDDVKEFIKRVEDNGEVLKNGAFVINYKKFKALAGDKLK